MLFLFDLDDTLIKGYLETIPCPDCGGRGRNIIVSLKLRSGSVDMGPCGTCRGHGTKLVHKPEGYDHIDWLPDRLPVLCYLAEHGHELVVVTNQTGPSYGYGTEAEVLTKMARVHDEFDKRSGGYDLAVLACLNKDDSVMRKPAPGLLLKAMTMHQASPFEVVMVGDLPTDEQAARAAHVAFNWAEDFFS